ncbi:MAG: hypothetical protein ACRD2O_09215 [Terriglobia bacterium]
MICLAALLFSHHTSQVQAQSLAGAPAAQCCSEANLAPRELDFPYYSLRNGYQSTLNLVSDSPQPIDLTIAIRSLPGHTLLTSATIQPQAKLAFDISSLIAKLGADATGEFAEGSVAVYFVGTIMPVVGQITITNAALSLTHESEMVEMIRGARTFPLC